MDSVHNLPLSSGASDVPESQTKEGEAESRKRVHRALVWPEMPREVRRFEWPARGR